ncbi:glycoside hydrolase family 99-like domain-containing protein [Frateuria terrea]|uniref:Lipopolysaccharide biosynthesis protein n=1 Tax=Frateuria terrea TaxID=529704 RepID=A0A1H6W0C1_9GAMM|nr:glycoside hydrolase family 99-like domain-containing protein [Frateuria terrea]SEJ06270.1 Lipopolysaccharide biosynthesis protein [Frateuria terrea]SFP70481.1 Lipopolysaccharide biosynthesis protein [Frateuria terrea]
MSPSAFAQRCLFLSLRACFRALPLPAITRDRLRQRFLDRYAHVVPAGPRGRVGDPAHAERRPRRHAGGRAIGYVERRAESLPAPQPATLVAFYLPQFHPIAQNDAWWGEGFTEWTNVARALPQFEGHAQPRLPGALGFYDLRLPEVMRKQMRLAREYGIGAFCSYFYWFGGERLLEQPLQQWLDDPSLDLPMCLCWANENWSRRWDGRAEDILIGQRHSAEDDLAFIAHVARYLRDPRYLRVEGKPLLLVYRPGLMPEPKATAARWRAWCRDAGIGEIQLAYVQSFDRVDPREIGFDAAVEFPPNNTTLAPITAQERLLNPAFAGDVFDWRELARAAEAQADPPYPRYPGVNPGWDNEPRRSGKGRVFKHASPRGYRDWLRRAIARAQRRQPAMVFINAWNEWAEGAVLEPDTRLGYAWLQATRDALLPAEPGRPHTARPCAIVHAWYLDVLDDIATALRASGVDWRIVVTTTSERADAVRQRMASLALDAELEIFENRGRDILPFLHVANRLLDEGTDVILKLHTKRSTHRSDGDQWRRELLERLLAPARATCILDAFRERPTLGIVYPEGHRQAVPDFWGANRANTYSLATRIGIDLEAAGQAAFVAGSMFWIRAEALRPLLDAHLAVDEFETEMGQIDGTQAHAVERLFMVVAGAAGFESTSGAAVCGLAEPPAAPYPYAKRGR